jgi:hypothetical protein
MLVALAISHLLMPAALTLQDYHYLCLWLVRNINKNPIQSPLLYHSIPFIFSPMAMSLMLGQQSIYYMSVFLFCGKSSFGIFMVNLIEVCLRIHR